MSALLLDVNILLALTMPTHVHHNAAHDWFSHAKASGYATCQLTQLGFLRLSMQPAVVKIPLLFSDAMQVLEQITSSPGHSFWQQSSALTDIQREIQTCIHGHNQLADAVLLDLAIRNKGQLATFDRRIPKLLPPGSPFQSAITVTPSNSTAFRLRLQPCG
jgi:uncharacterized protein